MSTPVLTLANQITLLRMGLAPLLVILVLERQLRWALFAFAVAGVSDLLDGVIARRSGQRTTLGAMLDPVADKMLLISSFVTLTWASSLHVRIPVWVTMITLSRDAIILVSVALINLVVGRRVFFPSLLGKLSTASQLVTVGVVLLVNAVPLPPRGLRALFDVTVLLTACSALHYVYSVSAARSSEGT